MSCRIYHHFTEKLRNKVEEFGLERMQMEVKMLRLKRDNWLRSCLSGYRHGFQAEICQRLTRTDTDYVYYFREQYKIEFGQNPLGEGQIRWREWRNIGLEKMLLRRRKIRRRMLKLKCESVNWREATSSIMISELHFRSWGKKRSVTVFFFIH